MNLRSGQRYLSWRHSVIHSTWHVHLDSSSWEIGIEKGSIVTRDYLEFSVSLAAMRVL